MGCKKGDARFQKALYDMYVDRLYNVIYRLVFDREEVKDMLQIAFVKIFRKIELYDDDKGHIYAWMCRVAINSTLSELRKNKIRFSDLEDGLVIVESACNKLDELEAEYILELLKQLPEAQRTIFNLFEIEGYTHKEIGNLLGIGESSSRTYLTRAKQKMRALLETRNHTLKTMVK